MRVTADIHVPLSSYTEDLKGNKVISDILYEEYHGEQKTSEEYIQEIKKTNQYMRAMNRIKIRMRYNTEDEEKLINERNNLIDIKYSNGLNAHQINRLQYLNWKIDVLEDAFYGDNIDQFEKVVEAHESLAQFVDKHMRKHGI